MLESFAVDALADIEAEHDVQRELLEPDQVDLLRHAFVFDFEVRGAKPGDDLTAIRDQHVDTDGFHTRRERRLLRTSSEPGPQQQRKSERNLHWRDRSAVIATRSAVHTPSRSRVWAV